MFTPSVHEYVGQSLTYSPAVSSFDRAAHTCNVGGVCILHPCDTVDVLSAWNRNAPGIDDDGMILLHVRSHVTGEASHVPDYEIAG